MKISQLCGKKVLSTAGKRGYVVSATVEDTKLASLVCADEDEKEFVIDAANVKSIKDKVIFKDEKSKIRGEHLRLGKPVYDCTGNFLGILTDFTAERNELVYAHVGKKKFSASDLVCGDAVIVKSSARVLKSDVKKNGRVIIRKGTPLTPEVAEKAQKHGELIQTNLKTI